MDSPLIEGLTRLNPLEILILALAASVMVYLFVSRRLDALVFLLVLSATFVGTTIPIVDNLSSLARWASILLILLSGLIFSRTFPSFGPLLFLGYAIIGFACLLQPVSFTWQFQRALLLLVVAASVPIAFGNRPYETYRSSLVFIAGVAALFSIANFATLPGHLKDPGRFMGLSKTAPIFADVLGGLVPFSLWGCWNARSKVLRVFCIVGFICGTICLVMSGQRTGTLIGIMGIAPIIFIAGTRRRQIMRSLLLLLALVMLTFMFSRWASVEKMDFLASRYALDSGLSDREIIWGRAISEIARNPLFGRGTGAAEKVFGSSYHSAYLEAWFNAGILGLVLYVSSQAYFFYRIYRLNRDCSDFESKTVLALALGYNLGFMGMGAVESIGAGASNVNVILYLFLGVLVSSDVLLHRSYILRLKGAAMPGPQSSVSVCGALQSR